MGLRGVSRSLTRLSSAQPGAHLNVLAVRRVGESSARCKKKHDADHDAREDLGEPMGVFHGFRDGDDEADAFEREDGGSVGRCVGGQLPRLPCKTIRRIDLPDEQRKVLRVEEGDIGNAKVGQDLDLVREDVDETKQDEGIGDKSRSRELLNVANHGEG